MVFDNKCDIKREMQQGHVQHVYSKLQMPSKCFGLTSHGSNVLQLLRHGPTRIKVRNWPKP